jgi:hypothetical protein
MEICARHPSDLPVAAGHLARCWLYGESSGDGIAAGRGTEAGPG